MRKTCSILIFLFFISLFSINSVSATNQTYYGEMWYHNDTHEATTVAFADGLTWYPLFFINATDLNGFYFQGGWMQPSNLTAQYSGEYKACYTAAGAGINNHNYFTTILVNNITIEKCSSHKKMSAGGDIVTMAGCCLLNLNASDVIELATMDYLDTGDGYYYAANLNIYGVVDELSNEEKNYWLVVFILLTALVLYMLGYYLEDNAFQILSGMLITVLGIEFFINSYPNLTNEFLHYTTFMILLGVGLYLIGYHSIKYAQGGFK